VKRRGLSLAELLVTLSLLSIAMAIMATLFRSAARSIYHSEQKDLETRSGVVACQQMREDLESAIFIYAPTGGATISDVSLLRMNPFDQNLNPPPLLDADQPWSAHATNLRWRVDYTLTQGRLLRQVQPLGAPATGNSMVAEKLTAFNCTLINDGAGTPVAAVVKAEVGQLQAKRTLTLEFPLHLPRVIDP
jgi:prepilin-type N-terminal cleavage/methylation domain-containing protein